MQQKKNVKYLILALLILLLFISFINMIDTIASFFEPSDQGAYKDKEIAFKEFELVNKALEIRTQAKDFIYKGTFDSPFRKLSVVPQRRTGRAPRKQTDFKKLYLKGTLIKENALAIIEDEDGKTYICKQGDLVHDRRIQSIENDKVTISDEGGATVLKVKER